MTEDEISRVVVDSAVEVHRTLGGPGLLESIYEQALAVELEIRGIPVARQRVTPVFYKGRRLDTDLRLDLVVGELVIVECKATTALHPVFKAQLLTQLRVTGLNLGLLINFGGQLVKDGTCRVVNGL